MKHKWHDEIVAWAGGQVIQFRCRDSNHPIDSVWSDCPSVSMPGFSAPGWEFRVKPETKVIRYRVALMDEGTLTADDAEEESRFAAYLSFVRWITDWIDYEVPA